MTSYATANEAATTTKKDTTTTTTATATTTATPTNPVAAVGAAAGVAIVANHNAESLTAIETTTTQQQQQLGTHAQQAAANIVVVTTTAATAADTLTKFAAIPTMLHNSNASILQRYDNNNYCMDYDNDDSLSDGREKTDTTPENIKKIADDDSEDDIIAQSSFYYQNRIATTAPTTNVAALDTTTHPVFQKVGSNYSATVAAAAAARESRIKNSQLLKPVAATPLSHVDEKALKECNKSSFKSFVAQKENSHGDQHSQLDNNGVSYRALNADEDGDSSASNSITNTATTTTTATTTETNNYQNYKQAFAFTIDSFDENESDPAKQAAKYKNMLERFQNRHRRGASMSKLENSNNANKETGNLATSSSALPLMQRSGARSQTNRNVQATPKSAENSRSIEMDANESSTTEPSSKVKLRARERSTSRVKDATKRHSWSPRSSMQDNTTAAGANGPQQTQQKPSVPPRRSTAKPPAPQPPMPATKSGTRTQFSPRSTAMQMALKNIDYLCPQPPLEDNKNCNADMDDMSETGTYTLDGDNYTEEQKDLMNIDSARARKQQHQRPKDLQFKTVNETLNAKVALHNEPSKKLPTQQRANNVLEVNYFHITKDEEPQQPANLVMTERKKNSEGSYLQKIKNRVIRNICSAKTAPAPIEMESTTSPDVGCFTSVTTSGVLAKQSALDPCPKLSRHASLSTSHIDSSEFVSNESKLKTSSAAAYAAGGFTDHQKSDYRLNVFTNQKEAQKFAATRNLIETPPQTPDTCLPPAKHPETEVLKTAEFRQDWVKEWARNVRARSLANEARRHTNSARHDAQQELMTRSYTSATETHSDVAITEEVLCAKLNKTLADRYRLPNGVGECDFSSEPALATTPTGKPTQIPSPSKIPSPLHSIGRVRSISSARQPAQNIFPQDEDGDFYLQKTAAAISSLQQSLSRRNSMKSPTLSASPRAVQPVRAALYSPSDERSPQHSLESHGYYSSPQHRRGNTQPLMTSSINEQQLHLLTSGEYLARQMRERKTSYDAGNFQRNSPVRRTIAKYETQATIRERQQQQQEQEQVLSPLRRSSSFSAKFATERKGATTIARPNYQNIYTPPAARHNNQNYTLALQQSASNHTITKSASSNTIRPDDERYVGYDDNSPYYINDQDEAEEYYSSGEEAYNYADNAVDTEANNSSASTNYANARYNKALLMRIEKNKQKLANSVPKQTAPPPTRSVRSAIAIYGAGAAACPNTPELPRRNVKSAPRPTRQSMPRENSLNRLATQVPQSLASAKKQLLLTAAANNATTTRNSSAASIPRVQPKYLDISKYKPVQGNNFLRKNDSKSTLKTPITTEPLKRSPSATAGLQRADPTRASNRSVRSMASSGMGSSVTSQGGGGGGGGGFNSRASSAARFRDASATKQKEAEMAIWKRRSKYDPMKAAAEDRRRKEITKRTSLPSLDDKMPFSSTTPQTEDAPDEVELQWSGAEDDYEEEEDDVDECY